MIVKKTDVQDDRDDVVSIEAHKTIRHVAERQAVERSHYALAVSLLNSEDTDEVDAGRELLEHVQVTLANDLSNSRQRNQRRELLW